jgi:plastocyanin
VLTAAVAAGPVHAADQDVAISGFTFSPRTVTVNVGDTVTWTNSDAQAHTATSGNAWSTGDIANGDSASITMRTAGTFEYICAIHPQMTGTVVVQAGTAPPTDTAPIGVSARSVPIGTLVLLGGILVLAALVTARRFGRSS